MKKFEYKELNVPISSPSGIIDTERLIRKLDDLGDEGWEAIGLITPTVVLLKRRKFCNKCGE